MQSNSTPSAARFTTHQIGCANIHGNAATRVRIGKVVGGYTRGDPSAIAPCPAPRPHQSSGRGPRGRTDRGHATTRATAGRLLFRGRRSLTPPAGTAHDELHSGQNASDYQQARNIPMALVSPRSIGCARQSSSSPIALTKIALRVYLRPKVDNLT